MTKFYKQRKAEEIHFSVKNYIMQHLKEIVFYFAIRLLYLGLLIIIPYYLSKCVDSIIAGGFFEHKGEYILYFVCLIGLEFIVSILVNNLNVKLSNKIAFQIEFDTLKHMKYVPYEMLKKYNDSYLTQRINNDAVCIGDYLVEKYPFFVMDILMIVIVSGIICAINLKTGILILLFILLYFVVYFCTKKLLYRYGKIMLEAQGNFFAMLHNQIFNMLLIKINAWYERTDKEFRQGVMPFFKSSVNYLRVEFTIDALNALLNRVIYGCTIIFLGIEMINGKISIGILSTITIYLQMLLPRLENCTNFGQDREKFHIAEDRISELFDLKREKNGVLELEKIETLNVENLSVRYLERTIFSGITMRFEKGNVYLISGENGSGKTTFIHTILGIITASQGNIQYNDIDLKEINLYKLRKKAISVTSQEPILQKGTIYENLTFDVDKENNTLQENEDLKKFLSFIEQLPEGYETRINSGKTELSGGEKQKIAIARTLLKNADLLIFDEPTSAMDIESIYIFFDIIQKIKKEHIIIMISHDEKIFEIADKVLKF